MGFDAFDAARPVVGMVHLPPLPGAPGGDDLDGVVERAVADAETLAAGGVDGVVVENLGDAPYHPEDVPKHTVAGMTRATRAVVEAVDRPVGVNVHVGARVADQGLLEGRAHETLRLRDRLDADVAVWADVDVKHSPPLGERSVRGTVRDACERGLADAVVVSGPATGRTTAESTLAAAVDARDAVAPETPVVVGSGVTADDTALLSTADGAIVGTALKEGGETTAPVDERRVTEVVEALR